MPHRHHVPRRYLARILGASAIALLTVACGATGGTDPSGSAPTVTDAASSTSSTMASAFGTVIGGPITVVSPTPPTSVADAPPTTSNTTATEVTSSIPAPTVVETTVGGTPLGEVPTGTIIVIDPGHNGANAQHPEIINQQVSAGFGQTKACNTTGTATDDGYAEHLFNWQVAVALRDLLTERGTEVVMTRDSDTGVGPCIDERATIGNDAEAAAVISIHGDGGPATVHGFFVMTSSHEPGGPDVAADTDRLAVSIRDALVADGFRVSNGVGTDGLWARPDLGGLNLSLRPSVMLELGNMRSPDDAAFMTSETGQQRYAASIARGLIAYLGG